MPELRFDQRLQLSRALGPLGEERVGLVPGGGARGVRLPRMFSGIVRAMRKRALLVVVPVLLLVFQGCQGGGAPVSSEAPQKGGAVPDFKLERLEGGELSFASLQGKVVLLDFWATWCKPCHEQTRLLNELYPDVRASGVEFLGVNSGEDVEKVKSFVKPGTFAYPVLLDPTDSLSLELDVVALPTLIIVDKGGKISFFHEGLLDAAALRREIKKAGA